MTPYYAEAVGDILDGLAQRRLWAHMGWQEVKRRYRRTVFGPFWATFSIGMFVGGMAFIWAPLFNTSVSTYMPYLTAGLVTWTFVVALVNEGCGTYTAAVSLITTLNFPYSLLNYMVVWRNIIVFFHNVLIVLVVNAALQIPLTLATPLVIVGLLIVSINGIWIGMLLGMVSARFRDIPPLVGNITQILMFVTPVFWQLNQLGERSQFFLKLNYIYHLVEIMRAPMLGQYPHLSSYIITIGGAVVGWGLALLVFARFRRRLPYWL